MTFELQPPKFLNVPILINGHERRRQILILLHKLQIEYGRLFIANESQRRALVNNFPIAESEGGRGRDFG